MKISKKELELRKWALEMSLEYGRKFNSYKFSEDFEGVLIPPDMTMEEVVFNAKTLLKTLHSDWENL